MYEYEFKKHFKFLELLSELFKNEIEHKFLEHAEVIKYGNDDALYTSWELTRKMVQLCDYYS